MNLHIGGVLGNPDLRRSEFYRVLTAFSVEVEKRSAPGPSLDLVFHLAGPRLGPDYSGMRTGKFSRSQETLTVQIAVPENEVTTTTPFEYVQQALNAAVKFGGEEFAKRDVSFPVETALRTIDEASKAVAGAAV